ncbi:uncharacterized protein LOC130928931 isoform X3 [Corythoichthys intestinalis]|uniref:uncharacterized protein LOC130928931 isoform X3 n=1 Tax=Corythoichthys intestinalis TaxID=161448 RepID=UPI0025A5EEAB|nr:uncharacterized protein LOC130928931 isoform X3 [Corythoichthys intestinalis]
MADNSQAQGPQCQESARIKEEEKVEESPYIKKVGDRFVQIKEEQEENPHIEDQKQPHPVKKEEVEEDPPYVKVELVDIPKWTDEPLKGEDGGPSVPNERAEPPRGSNSSSKEGFQADARPSDSDDTTSHSRFYCEMASQLSRPASGGPDPRPLAKILVKYIKVSHHLKGVKLGAPRLPQRIQALKDSLIKGIRPARPNDNTEVLTKYNAVNWSHTTMQNLNEHYTEALRSLEMDVEAHKKPNWHMSLDIAVKWAKKDIKRMRPGTLNKAVDKLKSLMSGLDTHQSPTTPILAGPSTQGSGVPKELLGQPDLPL